MGSKVYPEISEIKCERGLCRASDDEEAKEVVV